MGFGYADKLSYREDLGGSLGDPEHQETAEDTDRKVKQLADLIRSSIKVAAFTGAGISRAAGVPDFRGPTGIWTLQRAGLPIPKLDIEFGAARPTITHQFLVALQQRGKLTCVISQNVDGLHMRSGIERQRLSELHGNCFVERCGRCGLEFMRDFEMDTVGFKRTGRMCTCGGRLRDQVLDWDNELPDDEYDKAVTACRECDVLLCLGSSLRITPACDLPKLTAEAGGKLVIINLQKTQHDKIANLHIHAKCEDVMQRLASLLDYHPLPAYERWDTVRITFSEEMPRAKSSTGFAVRVSSADSDNHLTPLVKSMEVVFPDEEDLEGAELTSPPWQLRRRVGRTRGNITVLVRLQLGKDAEPDKQQIELRPSFRLGPLMDDAAEAAAQGTRARKRQKLAEESQKQELKFLTQRSEYS